MSQLRRIIVVGRQPDLWASAQEAAREVFVADDLSEALDIRHTVTPDLMVLAEAFTPQRIRQFLERLPQNQQTQDVTVAVISDACPFTEDDYKKAGVTYCLSGAVSASCLCDVLQKKDCADTTVVDPQSEYFLDETAAAVQMVGRSKALRDSLGLIKVVAASQCDPVLIVGETGTGKEIAARAVHVLRHGNERFVAVNCAALTANLLESELFGHVKGSFTGADRDKTGLFELAEGGTLFLDEISEMPMDLQAKLLRVLQEKTFRKVGGVEDIPCGATIIASSNRELKKAVEAKQFRADLYYRLSVCPIELAPLRSSRRKEDIALLAKYFLETSNICRRNHSEGHSITKLAIESLHQHEWPGNVRELRNVIDRAILLESTTQIGVNSIVIESGEDNDDSESLFNDRIKEFSLEKAERELIARALSETGWQKTRAAALLGITRATLYAKVKQYDIQKNSAHQSDDSSTSADSRQPVAAA